MEFNEYIAQVEASMGGKRLSQVKRSILAELWGEGEDFPGEWVESQALLAITDQKYFDRRVRELRDEAGCDIETGTYRGQYSYRLVSSEIIQATPRQYLTSSEKKKLFESCHYSCSICNEKFSPGVRGLQADHKIPLIRGGTHTYSNWQSICNVCNVMKRRACANCKNDCSKCIWAYPEKYDGITTVCLPARLKRKLEDEAKRTSKSVNEIIVKKLSD